MYKSTYGLINAKLEEKDSENAPLFSIEYVLLGGDIDVLDKLTLYMRLCHTGTKGLYNQFPIMHGNKDDYMSPDQLIAFTSAFLMAENKEALSNVWRYLAKNQLTYNNLKPNEVDRDRTMQLSAVLFSGVAAGHRYLDFFLSLVCIYSCFTKKKETSGKLKAWVIFNTLDMNITRAICNILISRNTYLKSWKGVFLEYFKEKDNPVRILAQKLKGE